MFKPYTYIARSQDLRQRLKSSSGGIFYELAKYIINQKGVVFGAAFNKDWQVDIIDVSNIKDLQKLCTSKYVMANLNNAYLKVERILKTNRKVLFTGTPCQIGGLKRMLKTDYDNLFCISVICHGTMPKKIYQDYLDSVKRPNRKIKSINFRDKTNGWRNYNMRIDYDDNRSLLENHKNNSYMKAFLCDKYLLASCYNCQFKNKNNLADISLADFWASHGKRYKKFDDNLGTSTIYIRTKKGEELINKIDSIIKERIPIRRCATSKGWKSRIYTKPKQYNSNLFKKRVGIVTLPLFNNIGGTLQNYALQCFFKEHGYEVRTLQRRRIFSSFFAKRNIKFSYIPFLAKKKYHQLGKNKFHVLVLGSDQIWRDGVNFSIKSKCFPFVKDWPIKKMVYGASFGVPDWQFDEETTKQMKDALKQYKYISVRENSAKQLCKKYLNLDVKTVIDPTLLFDKDFYLNICKDIPIKNGYHAYILDNNKEVKSFLRKLNNHKNIRPLKYSLKYSNVAKWLAGFRDAKFVITDSYHGCVFALLFNKPFLCLINKKRGNARFKHLIETYNIANRFCDSLTNAPTEVLNTPPQCQQKINVLRKESITFLTNALEDDTTTLVKTPS